MTLVSRIGMLILSMAILANSAYADVLCAKGKNVKILSGDVCRDGFRTIDLAKLGIAGGVGPQGVKGDAGQVGTQGPKGDTGSTGPQGATGAQGLNGNTGATGAQGPKGDKGDQGLQGATGVQGAKGNTGATGAQGLKGDKGDQGIQGVQGIKGATGAAGNALNFTTDVLMSCKHSMFTTGMSGPKASTDSFGRYSNQILAHCGSNQFMLSNSTTLQNESPSAEVVSYLIMRNITSLPVTNTSDFTGASNNSSAIPAGVMVDYFDSDSSNQLVTRLICCTLDPSQAVGNPFLE